MTPYKSNQEVFEIAVKWLRKQKVKSLSDDGNENCLYRGPNGLKCAIGCLIPDDLYNIEMDDRGLTVNQLLFINDKVDELFKNVNPCLLSELQCIHDRSFTERWEENWNKTAKSFNLKMI